MTSARTLETLLDEHPQLPKRAELIRQALESLGGSFEAFALAEERGEALWRTVVGEGLPAVLESRLISQKEPADNQGRDVSKISKAIIADLCMRTVQAHPHESGPHDCVANRYKGAVSMIIKKEMKQADRFLTDVKRFVQLATEAGASSSQVRKAVSEALGE